MKIEVVDVFALHGFLGSPEDWNLVFPFLREEKPHWNLHAVDLFDEYLVTPGAPVTMDEWALRFNQVAAARSSANSKRILLGYSMGGRLGLHALAQNPSVWSGAVFLSTNPGLTTNEEKLQRLENDKKWALRFAEEDLRKVLEDWNAQAVFAGAPVPQRNLPDDIRGQLVHALTYWSLGRQRNFCDFVDLCPVKQIWAAGVKDTKFAALLKTLPLTQEIQKWEVEDAAHRLPFEAPQEVAHFVARVGSPILV